MTIQLAKREIFSNLLCFLLRRRREAYQTQRCPDCAYPVPEESGKAMACAACGVDLYTACPSCDEMRHELLPHCRHCGAESTKWLGAV